MEKNTEFDYAAFRISKFSKEQIEDLRKSDNEIRQVDDLTQFSLAFAIIIVTLMMLIPYGLGLLFLHSDPVIGVTIMVLAGIVNITAPKLMMRILSKHVITRRMRLLLFTRANHLHLIVPGDIYRNRRDGVIFHMHDLTGFGKILDTVLTPDGSEIGWGNFMIKTGTKSRSEEWMYYIVNLGDGVALPHIYLETKKRINPTISLAKSLPATMHRIDLEGDFVDYFRTYVSEGGEQEALEVLAPDFMEKLIQYGSGHDIEIVGSQVYFYTFVDPFRSSTTQDMQTIFRDASQLVPAIRRTV